jgi:hypothetical protein
MKKLTPDYDNWAFNNVIILFTILVAVGFINASLNNLSNPSIDHSGYLFIIVSSIWILHEIWELRLLLNYLITDLKKTIVITESEIYVTQRSSSKNYKLEDLREIELVDRIFGSKAITSHLTYSKLKFLNQEEVVLTSLISSVSEIEKLFAGQKTRIIRRSRKHFELIN